MRKAHVKTVNEHLIEVLGFRRATTCEAFMVTWALFEAIEGRPPVDLDEFAKETGRSLATVYRWLADFKTAFPGHETPHELTAPVRQAVGEKLTVRRVGAMRADVLGVK